MALNMFPFVAGHTSRELVFESHLMSKRCSLHPQVAEAVAVSLRDSKEMAEKMARRTTSRNITRL